MKREHSTVHDCFDFHPEAKDPSCWWRGWFWPYSCTAGTFHGELAHWILVWSTVFKVTDLNIALKCQRIRECHLDKSGKSKYADLNSGMSSLSKSCWLSGMWQLWTLIGKGRMMSVLMKSSLCSFQPLVHEFFFSRSKVLLTIIYTKGQRNCPPNFEFGWVYVKWRLLSYLFLVN